MKDDMTSRCPRLMQEEQHENSDGSPDYYHSFFSTEPTSLFSAAARFAHQQPGDRNPFRQSNIDRYPLSFFSERQEDFPLSSSGGGGTLPIHSLLEIIDVALALTSDLMIDDDINPNNNNNVIDDDDVSSGIESEDDETCRERAYSSSKRRQRQ